MRITAALVVSIVTLVPATPALSQDRPRQPQGPPGTVTLPLAEYNRLLDRGSKVVEPSRTALLPFALSNASFRVRVDGTVARGTLRVDGEIFRTGPTRFPILTGGTLLGARSEAGDLAILQSEDTYDAVLPGPGPCTAFVEWGMTVDASPGYAAFFLPAAHAGGVTATIDLPAEATDVRVEPGFITRRQAESGRTTVDVMLISGERSKVLWSVREAASQLPAAEARMLADVKSLWRIGDADVQVIALVEITMIRGDARMFELRLPPGFEVSSVSGTSLETSESRNGTLVLRVRDAPERRHQFLVSAERSHEAGPFTLDSTLVAVPGAQRETGEVALEATGPVDVTPTGDPALRRMDVREVHAALRQLGREPLLAAFRYQRRPGETRSLALDVKRFPDAPVIAAVADRAVATTLVTTEGRTLTEIAMWVRNQAQPFVKVTLPSGATMLSVDVAGQSARPVQGSDGLRIPLLRAGFRPAGVYSVSFVYLNAETPFEKRGDARMALASIDLPIGMLEWELFVPERYSMKSVGGNVIPSAAFHDIVPLAAPVAGAAGSGLVGVSPRPGAGIGLSAAPGEILGRVVDATGAIVPGATIALVASGVRRTATTDENGFYVVGGVPSGPVTISAELAGFKRVERRLTFDQRPRLVDFRMEVSSAAETVTVTADAPVIDTRSAERASTMRPSDRSAPASASQRTEAPPEQQASQNVLNLQRRVAGVLPVRIDVPRTGTSHRFVRPLVLGDGTEVSLKYKRR